MLLETPQQSQSQRASTPASERMLESQRNLDETAELFKSLRTASSIDNDTKRMERVQEKLKSVTVSDSYIYFYTEIVSFPVTGLTPVADRVKIWFPPQNCDHHND